MIKLLRWGGCLFVSMVSGVILSNFNYYVPSVYAYMEPLIGYFFPRWFGEKIIMMIMIFFTCAPIGYVAKSRAAWFGLIASLMPHIIFYLYWLKMTPPRFDFTMWTFSYVLTAILYTAIVSGFCYLWWKWLFAQIQRPSRPGSVGVRRVV